MMSSLLRKTALATALALLPAIALGQAARAAAPASTSTSQAIDQRISALQSALAITPAQVPAWDSFAQTMRDNATATDALFAQRASHAATMTAVENMQSYAQIARAYADNTERLSAAFDVLYVQLSDSQKHAADVIFRQQASPAK